MLVWAGKALAELRGLKSQAKVSMKTPILKATLNVPEAGKQAIEASLIDIAEAGKVTGPLTVAVDNSSDTPDNEIVVKVSDAEIGEPPAKKPKKK